MCLPVAPAPALQPSACTHWRSRHPPFAELEVEAQPAAEEAVTPLAPAEAPPSAGAAAATAKVPAVEETGEAAVAPKAPAPGAEAMKVRQAAALGRQGTCRPS